MLVWQEGVCALIPAVRWLISTAVSRPQPGLLRSSLSLPDCPFHLLAAFLHLRAVSSKANWV